MLTQSVALQLAEAHPRQSRHMQRPIGSNQAKTGGRSQTEGLGKRDSQSPEASDLDEACLGRRPLHVAAQAGIAPAKMAKEFFFFFFFFFFEKTTCNLPG